MFSDLLAGNTALLCELVERRFRDFQVFSKFVDGENAAATVGGHKMSLGQGLVTTAEVKWLLSVSGSCCQLTPEWFGLVVVIAGVVPRGPKRLPIFATQPRMEIGSHGPGPETPVFGSVKHTRVSLRVRR